MSVSYIKARPVELQERTNYRSAFSGFLKKVERLASPMSSTTTMFRSAHPSCFLGFSESLGGKAGLALS